MFIREPENNIKVLWNTEDQIEKTMVSRDGWGGGGGWQCCCYTDFKLSCRSLLTNPVWRWHKSRHGHSRLGISPHNHNRRGKGFLWFVCCSIYFVCVNVLPVFTYVQHMCVWCSQRPGEGIVCPKTVFPDGCGFLCGCWEPSYFVIESLLEP